MTMQVGRLFTSVETNDYRSLWTMMQQMNFEELIAATTAIGPVRLRELLYRFVGQSVVLASSSSQSSNVATPETVIPEVLAQAFSDKSFLAGVRDKSLQDRVRVQLRVVHSQRATKAQIVMYRDITHTLPPPNRCSAPLSDADYEAAAKRHDVSVAGIKAVAFVESGGRSGFDEQYRPKILFEPHKFQGHTKNLFDLSHPHLSCSYSTGKKYRSWNQYSRLYEAMVLDAVAAIKSASWGKFQVLGENHSGWPDPVSFAKAMQESEVNQLKSFEAYCTARKIMIHVKNADWASFAFGYNGKNYALEKYDTKMADAYKRYGGK